MATRIYSYAGCSTCKKAIAWLKAHQIEASIEPIVDAPPSASELRSYWERSGLPLKKFFNTSGKSYREGGFSARLPEMSEEAQLKALAADGKLIKRPLLVTDTEVLVGFKETAYADVFGATQ